MEDADPQGRLLDQAQGLARNFLRSLPDRPVGARATLESLRSDAARPLTDGGVDAAEVLRDLDALAQDGVIASAGPRYFGFVIGGSYPVALATDWLVSTWDQNPGLYATSPFGAVVEEAAARYVLDLLDLPAQCTVGFTTGCQMANFTGLAAARHKLLADAGWDVEADGLQGAPTINLVMGAEAHVTIHTALRYLGFGLRHARLVACDGQGRMIASELEQVLAGCVGPTLVCAQAGNVNTGALDPLEQIGRLCNAHGAWLHVDGAFGLWARATPRYESLARGAELADSWATDAHKWLNVPYDCGIVVVKDGAAHRGAMAVRAAYLEHAAHAERDEIEYVPEFSRRGRAIPVYATLRHLGRQGVATLVDRCCAHARLFAEVLGGEPGVSILNDVVLNQVLVRFGDSDELTRAVIARVQHDGTCWLGGTTWHGQSAMRISVSNWSTAEADVRRSTDAILKAFRDLATDGSRIMIDQISAALANEFALPNAYDMTVMIARLLTALVLGALLGLEREHRGRAAGLKTHMLVSVGSALFVLAPLQMGVDAADVTRVMQGIVSGIGFLGAGAIIRHQGGERVEGLTTAAGIWMTSAIGMAAGMGREFAALVTTVLALLVFLVIPRLERIGNHREDHS